MICDIVSSKIQHNCAKLLYIYVFSPLRSIRHNPGVSFAGVVTIIIRDPLDGDQFQSQFTDERLHILPVLHGDIFQRSIVLSFLLPAHNAVVMGSSRSAVVVVLLLLLDRLGFLGGLDLVLLSRLLALYLR